MSTPSFQVDHLLDRRLHSSLSPATLYLSQFPHPLLTLLFKLIALIVGSLAVFLLVIALIDESLLEAQVRFIHV